MKAFIKGVLEEFNSFKSAFNERLEVKPPTCFGIDIGVKKTTNEKCIVCKDRGICIEEEKKIKVMRYLSNQIRRYREQV